MPIAQYIVFWILALVSIVSALMVITNPNPVRSALFLVLTFLCVAVFYLSLSAQFIAAVQVIVYAGAIMVLFLFVIMLLNMGAPEALKERGGIGAPIAAFLGLMFLGMLAGAGALNKNLPPTKATAATLANGGTVETIGTNL